MEKKLVGEDAVEYFITRMGKELVVWKSEDTLLPHFYFVPDGEGSCSAVALYLSGEISVISPAEITADPGMMANYYIDANASLDDVPADILTEEPFISIRPIN